MTELLSNFDEFFGKAFQDKEGQPQRPFDYQRRLALDDPIPSLVNAPTGAGKTNAITCCSGADRTGRCQSVGWFIRWFLSRVFAKGTPIEIQVPKNFA